jgi:large subunit ribosomal protein L13
LSVPGVSLEKKLNCSLGHKNKVDLRNKNKFYTIFFFFRKYVVFLQTPKYGVITLNISVSIKNQEQVNTLSYKTVSANKATVNKEWVIIDAEGQVLGRLASVVAFMLRGKHKTEFTPHVDCGDNVIVINAEKVGLTGKKWADKLYVRHTGFPGGQRFTTADAMMKKNPISLVEKAVKGMLPRNRLGSALYRNLHVYAGAEHPHEAQKPKKIEL